MDFSAWWKAHEHDLRAQDLSNSGSNAPQLQTCSKTTLFGKLDPIKLPSVPQTWIQS